MSKAFRLEYMSLLCILTWIAEMLGISLGSTKSETDKAVQEDIF
jgi:hypothetical protein